MLYYNNLTECKNAKNPLRIKNIFIALAKVVFILFMIAACREDHTPPAIPKGFAFVVENNAIKVSWDRVRYTDAFRVDISADGINFTFHSNTDENFFIHENPVAGINYYRVRSIRYGNKGEYFSKWSEIVSYNFIHPGGGTESGLYLGIIGFNNDITTRKISFLTRQNRNEFQSFVNDLETRQGTGLYFAVDNAINMLQGALLPEDLANISIVTFTDGLDNFSIELNPNFNSRDAYRDAVRNRLNTKIRNLPINAYSIGIQGGDVVDVAAFRAGLAALASNSSNVHEATSMSDVNNTFRDIANSLYFESQRHILKLKITGGIDDGTRIRFTFDDVGNNASASNVYIEGVFRRSGNSRSLQNINYHGLRSSSATTITGSLEAGFVTFNFDNVVSNATGNFVSTNNVQQWEYISSSSQWQRNSEFDPTSNMETIQETRSAVIMLVLDCTTSLDAGGANGFSQMKNAANNFIETLTR